uniref:Molybdenum cofactor sulfurase middle domain-containing protein n=1 Tax=Anopheles coluzzii TaxID=1518534 RepID=A0A8W7NZP1_ANOCL
LPELARVVSRRGLISCFISERTKRHQRNADGLSDEMLSKLLNDGAGGKPTAGQLLAVAAGVGVATALGYGVYRLLQYRAAQQPPSEWHRVGEVSDLWIYPIKSCGAVRVRQFQCSPIGPQVGFLRDRIFMVVKSADGKFITGRSHPTLVLVQPAFDAQYERMTLCLFTNVDPETGVSSPEQEPLTTLRKYRLKPGLGQSPVVGMQMGIRTLGAIGLGDAVYVG